MNVNYCDATYMLDFWDARGMSYDMHINLIKVGIMHMKFVYWFICLCVDTAMHYNKHIATYVLLYSGFCLLNQVIAP